MEVQDLEKQSLSHKESEDDIESNKVVNDKTDNKNQETAKPDDETVYDPYRRPPFLSQCEKHWKATRCAKIIPKNVETEIVDVCPCCGCSTELEDVSLWCDVHELKFLGVGYPLYFKFILFCILLLCCLLLAGLPALINNSKGEVCKQQPECNEGFIQNGATYNRDLTLSSSGDIEANTGQGTLNVITLLLVMLALLVFRYYNDYFATKLDEETMSPADYTIKVKNLPQTETKEEIKEFMSNCLKGNKKKKRKHGKNDEVVVEEIVMSYYIGDYMELQQEIHKQKIRQIKLENKPGDNSTDIEEIKQDVEKKELILESLEKELNDESQLQNRFTGTAFVTVQTEQDVMDITKKWKLQFWDFYFTWLTNKNQYKDHRLQMEQAFEPSDILWENLGTSNWSIIKRRIATNFATLVTLGVCFLIIFGISLGQKQLQNNETDENGETSTSKAYAFTLLSLLGSMVILFINTGIKFVIKKYASLEKHESSTYQYIATAKKLGLSQFLNTAIVTLIVNALQNKKQIYIDGGLIENIHFTLLLNAFLNPIMLCMNFGWVLKMFKQKKLRQQLTEDRENCKTTQQEAQLIFSRPATDPSFRYAGICKTLLFTAFYASLIPVGIIYGIVSLIFQYWIEKVLLLRRDQKPIQIQEDLPNEMINFFMELLLITYACGCLYTEIVIYNKLSGGTIAVLVIACFYFLLPVDQYVKEKWHPEEKLCSSVRFEKEASKIQYQDAKQQFYQDGYEEYIMTNPITKKKAQEERIKVFLSDQNLTADQKKQIESQMKNFNALNAYGVNRMIVNPYIMQSSPFQGSMFNMMGRPNQVAPQRPGILNNGSNIMNQFMPMQMRPGMPMRPGMMPMRPGMMPMRPGMNMMNMNMPMPPMGRGLNPPPMNPNISQMNQGPMMNQQPVQATIQQSHLQPQMQQGGQSFQQAPQMMRQNAPNLVQAGGNMPNMSQQPMMMQQPPNPNFGFQNPQNPNMRMVPGPNMGFNPGIQPPNPNYQGFQR